MPATESDRILAAGIPLTLADGRAVTVRYSMRSLKAFEDAYGSAEEALALLNALLDGTNKRQAGTLIPILAIGLLHEDGLTEDALYDLTEPQRRSHYFDVIVDAINEALPIPGKDAAADHVAAASNGVGSTTPPTVSATTANGSGE